MNESNTTWENMTPEEKKKELFLRQKKTLDLFLNVTPYQKHNTIRASAISSKEWEYARLNE